MQIARFGRFEDHRPDLLRRSTTLEEARISLQSLDASIDSIQQSSHDIARRVANVELANTNESHYKLPANSIVCEDGDNTLDAASKTAQDLHESSKMPPTGEMAFGLCSDLQSKIDDSWVYRRARKRHSTLSSLFVDEGELRAKIQLLGSHRSMPIRSTVFGNAEGH